YRSPINFSQELMEQAKNGLGRMRNCLSNLNHLIETGNGAMTEAEAEALKGLEGYREKFINFMEDDLNTADAISAIFELVRDINTAVKDGASKEFAEKCKSLLDELTAVLGLLRADGEEDALDDEIQKLVAERQEARKAKNFARADEIRDILKEKGITLKDTPQGVQIIRG
ncbi:MAG: cysteine--tRNA ligase, partial [Firmicutes bacterium]|nr:cysteine--tRNA ligase [Bacillota bacterium]